MANREKVYALFSVSDKRGIGRLARAVTQKGMSIISTGGTAKILKEEGIPFVPIETITGSPESFGGRMKTISFQIESGILYDRSNPHHVEDATLLQIPKIDLVVCNFYPFQQTIAKQEVTLEEAIENIDIGGPTMVRAAAKNFRNVAVVVDPDDYPSVIDLMDYEGQLPYDFRFYLAAKAFTLTADYDSAIDPYMSLMVGKRVLRMNYRDGEELRYGENPHQKGWIFKDPLSVDPLALWKFQQLQGKEMSFNNFLDMSAAIDALVEITVGGHEETPACVILKHQNPSGAAISEEAPPFKITGAAFSRSIKDAYLKAWYDGDSLASYGGIIVVNKEVDKELAQMMIRSPLDKEDKFFEVLVAPSVTAEALEVFAKYKGRRVLVNLALADQLDFAPGFDFKRVRGGILVQDIDRHVVKEPDLLVVSETKPSPEQIRDILFAWRVAKVSKSNSIVLVENETLIASGVGQQDRKRCCELAVSKAGERAKGTRAASDAFFPMSDGPQELIKAGIVIILHPGGSKKDQETIDLCNKNGVVLVFTSKDYKELMIRCFKH